LGSKGLGRLEQLKISLFQEEDSLDIHIKEEDIADIEDVEDIGDVQDVEDIDDSEDEDLIVEKVHMHISDLTEEIGKVRKKQNDKKGTGVLVCEV